MAQLTSVWLRVRADNSIDRRCSTDTAYPFQPHRARLIRTSGCGGGSPLDATRAAAVEGCKGRSRGDCGIGQRHPAAAVLQHFLRPWLCVLANFPRWSTVDAPATPPDNPAALPAPHLRLFLISLFRLLFFVSVYPGFFRPGLNTPVGRGIALWYS